MARMTVSYPDVSSAQAGMSLAGAAAVCIKISEGTGYVNPFLGDFRQAAVQAGAFAFGYHFLHPGQADGQAANCKTANTTRLPVMIDCESVDEFGPSLGDLVEFVDAYRRLDGTCWLAYLPRWYWSAPFTDGGMGCPSLEPLISRGMSLVSSDYTTYSDDGPGWAPYGGMTPAVWQYTSTADMNGRLVDRNAFRGTLIQLERLVMTGSAAAPPPAQEEDDDPMMLESGDDAETIFTFSRGSKSWVSFGCNASRTHSPAPKLRVAVHSNSKGWSQIVDLEMPVSGKTGVNFCATDADMISVVRQTGNAGDNVGVGFNLG